MYSSALWALAPIGPMPSMVGTPWAEVKLPSEQPPVVVNVSSHEVNIDKVLASLAVLGEKDEPKAVQQPIPAPTSAKKSGPLVPKDLSAKGEVRIVKALYQQMAMSDFYLTYALEKGVFTIKDLKGRLADDSQRLSREIMRLHRAQGLTPIRNLLGTVLQLVLFLVLFVPMQWGAPAGAVRTYHSVVEIVPNVSGEVSSVPVQPLVPLKQGDVLFTIDPIQYQAKVEQLEATVPRLSTTFAADS